MKLSADSLHEDEGFAVVLQTVTEDLRRGTSFAPSLGRQTFGRRTGPMQEVGQCACRLQAGWEPARSPRLTMSGALPETRCALGRQPRGALVCGHRASCNSMRSIHPYRYHKGASSCVVMSTTNWRARFQD